MGDSAELLWTPGEPQGTHMARFALSVGRDATTTEGYGALHKWSCDDAEAFWTAFIKYAQLPFLQGRSPVVERGRPIDEFPRWFPEGAPVNYAQWILDSPHSVRIHSANELGEERTVSMDELRGAVAGCQQALRACGITRGDRVCAYAPNCIEVLELYLAAASLGAVFTAASPDFGVSAVVDRFAQIGPKVMLTGRRVWYNGKEHALLDKARQVQAALPGLVHMVVIEDDWGQFAAAGGRPSYESVPFDHPLIILYSSGTTGRPKCIVHGHGGTMLQHCKEHLLHGNVCPGDVYLQYTTVGWMMWPWMVSALALGASIVLYDGSPLRPAADQLFTLCRRFSANILGVSAKYLQQLSALPQDRDYSLQLKLLLSTASPLDASTMRWCYERICLSMQLASICGGTDIIGLFMGGCPSLPLYAGQLQCRCLGMALDLLPTDVGASVGDLVCRRPFPSMPVCFWNDPQRVLYRAAYFAHGQHYWYHGDYVQFDPVTGGCIVHGRSDGTLNPSGIRFGSSEVYNALNGMLRQGRILDALVVGVANGPDEDVTLFVQVANADAGQASIADEARQAIRQSLSPRHVPKHVFLVTFALPYTPNGKKIEVGVKKYLSGLTEDPALAADFQPFRQQVLHSASRPQ